MGVITKRYPLAHKIIQSNFSISRTNSSRKSAII